MNKPKHFLVVAILILLLYAAMAAWHPGTLFLLEPRAPDVLLNQWQLVTAGGDAMESGLALPVKLEVPVRQEALFTHVLPEPFAQSQHLLLRSSLQSMKIRVDGEQVYEAPFVSHPLGFMPHASVWNLVRIPEGSAGKTLTVVLSSPFRQMSGRMQPVYYGHPDTLLFHILSEYGITVFYILFLLFAGFFMFILLLVSRSLRVWSLMYLGSFSILIGLWILAESRMLQFVTGNQFLHASLAYVSIALVPIPMVRYVAEIVSERWRKLLMWLQICYYVNFVLIVGLQVLDVLAFFQSIVFTHAAILMGIALCLYVIVQETIRSKNRDALHFLLSFSVLPLFGLAEIVVFYTSDFSKTSSLVRFGLLLFILLQSIQVSFHIRQNWEKVRKADLFEELAYTDSLTLAPNRQAFERDLHRAFSEKSTHSTLWIGVFDLNNLKIINDNWGHAMGDDALRNVYRIIDAVCAGEGVCYRIGGDEFACILSNSDITAAQTQSLSDRIDTLAAAHQRTVSYPFEIALGFAVCTAGDASPETVFQQADQAMYRDKDRKKSARPFQEVIPGQGPGALA